ncbi:carboxymuconolactone decarboxylase family protein [Chelatococcus sp. GCM10030263]|uniref:carboxymuconolactone decarboxylase family protein n=1 Tax=Chelatococcus sp. GCM10030263 TaxID=3273387 RepID=UPI00361BF185
MAIDKAALKEEIMRERGYWARFHDVLLEHAPEFLQAYIAFQAAPARSQVLDRKLCEFIYIAIDISVNHMYERGARRHMGFALQAGATKEELLQVLLLTTVMAAQQPIDSGLAILSEELGASASPPLDAGEQAIKASYAAATGHWPEAGDLLLARTPDLAEGYMAYGRAVWDAGPLTAKEKELIALAICASPTALHEPGMRRHIKGALAAEATPEEIATVLQLAAAISIHSCTLGIPGWEDVINGKLVE